MMVLGYGLWQRRFGGDRAIAGKTVLLSGHPFTVVGVAPPAFRGIDVPLDPILGAAGQPGSVAAQHQQLRVARLSLDCGRGTTAARRHRGAGRRGTSTVIARHLAKAYPASEKDGGFRFEQAGSLPPRDGNTVMLFLGALTVVVLLVLAIACANVANLFGAGFGPATGDGGTARVGRHARPADAPDAHRKRAAGDRRRLAGRGAGAVGYGCAFVLSACPRRCRSI